MSWMAFRKGSEGSLRPSVARQGEPAAASLRTAATRLGAYANASATASAQPHRIVRSSTFNGLVEAVAGVLPQADDTCGIEPARTAAVHQAPSAEGQYGGTRVVGEHTRVPGGPPRCELRPVKERRHDPRRSDRADEVGDLVVLSEVLADQDDNGESLAELDEVQDASGDVHGFPPPHRGVQFAAKVVLVDLPGVQGPSMMLVLPDVEPAGAEALQRFGPALLHLW